MLSFRWKHAILPADSLHCPGYILFHISCEGVRTPVGFVGENTVSKEGFSKGLWRGVILANPLVHPDIAAVCNVLCVGESAAETRKLLLHVITHHMVVVASEWLGDEKRCTRSIFSF
jgi:hypothetical protein